MQVYRIRKGLFCEDWAVEAEERESRIKFTATRTVRIGPLKLKTETVKGLLPFANKPIEAKYVRIVGVVGDQIQDVILPSVIYEEITKQFLMHKRIPG